MTLDESSFTNKIAIPCGGGAIAPYTCVELLDTGFPNVHPPGRFRSYAPSRYHLAGVRAILQYSNLGGFGQPPPLLNSSRTRLGFRFFRSTKTTCSIAVWACVVPHSVMRHAALPGRDSRMPLKTCSYRTPPPSPTTRKRWGFRGNDVIPPRSGRCVGLR